VLIAIPHNMKYPATHRNADRAWLAAFTLLASVIRARYAVTYVSRRLTLLAWQNTKGQPRAVTLYDLSSKTRTGLFVS
jgi:hypothetical protein